MKTVTKGLLGVALALILMVSADRAYKFYLASQPPFQVGECFQVQIPDMGLAKAEVTANNTAERTSDIKITIDKYAGMEGVTVHAGATGSYADIRALNPVKVSCE